MSRAFAQEHSAKGFAVYFIHFNEARACIVLGDVPAMTVLDCAATNFRVFTSFDLDPRDSVAVNVVLSKSQPVA